MPIARVILGDYRRYSDQIDGRTLYIGNPPYVRHHQITTNWKDWLFKEADKVGLAASNWRGCMCTSFWRQRGMRSPAISGAFTTAAEWLDVNYGSLVRSLVLNQLGGQGITVIDPTAQPFPDAATTAAITKFEIASKPKSLFFRRVDNLRNLDGLKKGRKVHRDRLCMESRWSFLTRASEKAPEGGSHHSGGVADRCIGRVVSMKLARS